MSPFPERRFTDEQVALVLRTAAELQEVGGQGGAGRGGLTLAQLEQVAAEAGIEPSALRRAVARLDQAIDHESHSHFVGGPTRLVVQQTIPGTIGPEDFERFLAILRRVTGQLGESSGVGRLFGWKGQMEEAACEVSISSEGGLTTVRVRLEPDQHLLGQFMLKGMLGGVGGGIVTSAAVSTLIGGAAAFVLLGIVGGGYYAARRGFRRDVESLRRRMSDLADALAQACSETAARSSPERQLP